MCCGFVQVEEPFGILALEHYCDEVSQGITQATSDARTLHDSVARLAAQCTPHELSAPPAAAAIAPATASAIEAAAAASAAAPVGAPGAALSNVVGYSDHSTGNIYQRHGSSGGGGSSQKQLVRTPSPHAN